MKFRDFKDAEQIQDYQRRVLSRPGRLGKTGAFLLHYTDINSIVSILESGKIYLSSCRGMNDTFEEALLERHGIKDRLHYLCLSKAEESLAMYKMYQKGKGDTAILKLSYSDIEGLIRRSVHGEFAGGIDDDGKYIQYHRVVGLIRNGRVTTETVGASLYCVEVLYLNPTSNAINSRNDVNRQIRFPLREQDLIGSIKYQCWNYEQEVRLCGFTDRPLKSNEKIAVDLPESVYCNLKVVLGPDFDTVTNKEALHSLNEFGINYTHSIYGDFYSGIL